MEIKANQVHHVLRTYKQVIKKLDLEETKTDSVEEKKDLSDGVTLSPESIKRLHADLHQNVKPEQLES